MDTLCVRLSCVNQRMVLLYHLLTLFNQNMFCYGINALILTEELSLVHLVFFL